MSEYQRFAVREVEKVVVARFMDRKISDVVNVDSVSDELTLLSESLDGRSLVLDFEPVQFLSSAVLNRLIILDGVVKRQGGRLRLCGMQRSIADIFKITKLTQVFSIHDDVETAIAQ
ncbi:MAG: STAS domain-containing protein [Pirellulaceae bacterium]|jgi:anti-sigma B factor antagonist|nr:STAS domain-containing protein [Pirellulaceae bacterium]MDP7020253.1 STAS domain-containing protein [Pirellulaceae bacterium]